MTTESKQPEAPENTGDILEVECLPKAAAQISLLALATYNFIFILLTLHGPYIFLYTRPNLVITAQGIDYDMGGLFPHLAAMIVALTLQTGLALLITMIVGILRRFFRNIDAFSVSFFSICGLQMLVYYEIYFPGKTDPAILQAFGSFSLSRALLAIFMVGSLLKIYAAKPVIKTIDSEKIQTD